MQDDKIIILRERIPPSTPTLPSPHPATLSRSTFVFDVRTPSSSVDGGGCGLGFGFGLGSDRIGLQRSVNNQNENCQPLHSTKWKKTAALLPPLPIQKMWDNNLVAEANLARMGLRTSANSGVRPAAKATAAAHGSLIKDGDVARLFGEGECSVQVFSCWNIQLLEHAVVACSFHKPPQGCSSSKQASSDCCGRFPSLAVVSLSPRVFRKFRLHVLLRYRFSC